jgi:hypothetical protein
MRGQSLMHRYTSLLLLPLFLLASPVQAASVPAGHFSAGELAPWETRVFNDATRYQLVELDGQRVLRAECDNAAAAYYRRLKVNLAETPILRWRWRVDGIYPGLDETKKQGDDYPARIYVVIDGGALIWRTKALNYVWASNQPAGSVWPNAYTKQAMMVAVRSGMQEGWQEESRDLRKDFKDVFGIDASQIDGVALMTDCDDAKGRARAWYGDIVFTAQ